ncbi:amino acid transporter [Boletus reticuloceps]|uniref:Amino acid transporter n=1 Tax=Boletus reticuloceps TaxID=495285 RepID=A0A8I3A8S5_9AGAM|nr:amino acid transporter [Boletus reticuloceps]
MATKDAFDLDFAARQGLEKLGYTQEMTRRFTLVDDRCRYHSHAVTLGSSDACSQIRKGTDMQVILAIMAVPYGLAAPIATSLAGGGPAVMLWGWVLVSIFTQMLALSLAEICSKYPTSAGAYYWCYRLAPPRYKLIFSWINGWLNLVGNWTITLSVTFGIPQHCPPKVIVSPRTFSGTAQLIVAGVGIYLPEWVATPWQTYVIFLGVTAVACGFCLFFNKYLPSIDIACACWTALGIIITLICVSAKATAGRRPASFAFDGFEPASGWTPGWSFFIGLLPVSESLFRTSETNLRGLLGTVTSMAEEVHDPSKILPKAISLSVPIGTIWGVVFLLPILFTLPDVTTLLQVSSGQPIGVMFTLIMGSQAGGFGLVTKLELTHLVFGVGMFCAISISCAASRATWAFARDKAIPFHAHFSKISPLLPDVPVNALLLSTFIQVLLGLIYLGSSAAFNAFVGVAVMCLGASYALPVAISLAGRRREVSDAPFQLGAGVGTVVNTIAVLWVAFAIVLFSMPAIVPVTRVTMNYASVVFIGFAVVSAVWYWINGRFHYTGPPVPPTEVTELAPSTPTTSKGE